MDQLATLLQSVLSLTARQGWIWLLAGGAVLGLNRYAIEPFDKLDGAWLGLASVATVFGGAMLVVSFVGWLINKGSEAKAASKLKREREKRDEAHANFVLRNLETLTNHEIEALVWILRRDRKRFSDNHFFMLEGELRGKGIVIGPLGNTIHTYEVSDVAWERRRELLEIYSVVKDTREPPWKPAPREYI